MINSHMPYYAPYTQGNDALMLWLNLDPDYRTTSGTATDWKNFMKPSEIFGNTNSARHPTDNGTHLTFDGGDFLTCNVDRDLVPSGGGWTVYTRYKEDDWSDNSVFAADDDSNNSFIKNVGDAVSIKTYDGSSHSTKGIAFDTPTDLVDDTYYNLAVTCTSGGTLKCYIDGVLQAASSTLASTAHANVMAEVGGKNGAGWMLNGSIQELLVWHNDLSAQQITDINKYLNNKF